MLFYAYPGPPFLPNPPPLPTPPTFGFGPFDIIQHDPTCTVPSSKPSSCDPPLLLNSHSFIQNLPTGLEQTRACRVGSACRSPPRDRRYHPPPRPQLRGGNSRDKWWALPERMLSWTPAAQQLDRRPPVLQGQPHRSSLGRRGQGRPFLRVFQTLLCGALATSGRTTAEREVNLLPPC